MDLLRQGGKQAWTFLRQLRGQSTPHRLRVVLDHLEQDARRALGAAAALLPALHRGEAEAEALGEALLRYAELASEGLDVELGRDVNDQLARALAAQDSASSRMLPRRFSPASDSGRAPPQST